MKKDKAKKARAKADEHGSPQPRHAVCWETVGGDPHTAMRLSFSIKVF